jgi:hypothetical protein
VQVGAPASVQAPPAPPVPEVVLLGAPPWPELAVLVAPPWPELVVVEVDVDPPQAPSAASTPMELAQPILFTPTSAG